MQVSSKTYCGDRSGERSDYCIHSVRYISDLVSFAWTVKFNSWKDLKIEVRKRLGATFILPVANINQEYKIIDPETFEENKHLVEAVIFTNDLKIKEIYGVKMKYYSYSFLRREFEIDFERYKKNRGS